MRYHRTLSVDVEVHGTEMLMRHSSGEKPYTEDAAERFIIAKPYYNFYKIRYD
jgi:hypothetical protein